MNQTAPRDARLFDYEPAKSAAERIGMEYSWFTRLLNRDRVPGAFKWGREWMVPKALERKDIV